MARFEPLESGSLCPLATLVGRRGLLPRASPEFAGWTKKHPGIPPIFIRFSGILRFKGKWSPFVLDFLQERSALMKLWFFRCATVVLSISMFASYVQAGVVSFGSGANQFAMEFVTIGNPGNAPDTTGAPNPAGAVGYTYGIGKFEVSRDMITKFNGSQSLQITLQDMTFYGGNGANKPATGVSWNEAARFVNWLNTSTGNQPAYKFTTIGVNDNIALWTSGEAGYNSSNPYRNSLAKYVLPNSNEWYKAAYYNPSDSTYYDFPNGSNMGPYPIASGASANTAIYMQAGTLGPAEVDLAGGLSPYGVMGLGGNIEEWHENVVNSSTGSSHRLFRGEAWFGSGYFMSALTGLSSADPRQSMVATGFRVASLSPSGPPAVPEPSMMVIGTLFGLGGLVAKRRMKK
jgi:sulfatase modifying factor 1